MKQITSFTAFVDARGQQIAYSYSIIDENTGATIQDNIRASITVLDIPKNKDVLANIAAVNEYIMNHLEA